MKVYCVSKFVADTNSTELIEVFRNRDKAMEMAKLMAEEMVKGYSMTRSIQADSNRYLVWWCEDEEVVDCDGKELIAAIYVSEKLVIN